MGISITIIIPCFNGWKWMSRCLNSLENQIEMPDEIIIWDDCSTDGSFDNLRDYCKISRLNIRLYRNDINSGPSISRKKAIRKATSTFVAFCDADDWYENEFVYDIKKLLRNRICDFIMFNSYTVYDDKKYFCDVTSVLNKHSEKSKQMALSPMSLCRIVVNKNLFDKVKFNDLYYGEDALILYQLIILTKDPIYLKKAYYNYFMREGSAHKSPNKRCFTDAVVANELLREYFYEDYPNECTFLGVKNLVYNGTILGFKAGIDTDLIMDELKRFKSENPKYIFNKYISNMSLPKRLYIVLAYFLAIRICKFLSMLHEVVKNSTRMIT